MNAIVARYCLPISIIASTLGMLLHVFLFGRALLGELDETGLIFILVIGFVPGVILSPIFRRWNHPLFIAGNIAMFASSWWIVLLFPNMGLPSYSEIGLPLGIYLGGAVLVVGTGTQYCILTEQEPRHQGLRVALIVFGAIASLVFLPFFKITLGFTAYFTVGGIFNSTNLIFLALSNGAGRKIVDNDLISKQLRSRGKKTIGCITTLIVVIGALLTAQVTYYLGQDTLYAAERTVLVWPLAAAVAGVYIIVRVFTSKTFSPLVLTGVALAQVLLMINVPSFAYSWGHVTLVGATYAFAFISYLELMPFWIPIKSRRKGPFFAFVGFFTVLGIAMVGYVGGIPVHSDEIPPIINVLLYFGLIVLLVSVIPVIITYYMNRKVETP